MSQQAFVKLYQIIITGETHCNTALSANCVIGGKSYGLLQSLTAPDKPRDKSFKHITDTLQQHFLPKPLISAEHFRFHRRNRGESESVTHAEELAVSMETASREAHQLSGSLTRRPCSQASQVLHRAGRLKPKLFGVGDAVLARDYRGRERWTSGVVMAQSGPVSYTVDIGASEEWRRHADQLLSIPNQTAETQFTELPDNKNVSVPVQTSVNASCTGNQGTSC
ncbi:hypothetical protein QQF64_018262 [Cirrhinus molitorella]|uniref:Uncharacterized protein n=1 Tax=Cirrhinus molitorella TaxID=172907 RepID=A0ABR3LEL8_9TELE